MDRRTFISNVTLGLLGAPLAAVHSSLSLPHDSRIQFTTRRACRQLAAQPQTAPPDIVTSTVWLPRRVNRQPLYFLTG